MKAATISLLISLLASPLALAAGTVSFKVPEVVVRQDSGAAVIPIVFSGTPTGSGFSDVLLEFVDGSARGYRDYESPFYYSGVGIDFVEGESEKNFVVPIYFTKSPVTKFFNVLMSGYNGSSVGAIATVRVTILGWSPSQATLNRIKALKRKLKLSRRIRNPQRRQMTVQRLQRQIRALVASIS